LTIVALLEAGAVTPFGGIARGPFTLAHEDCTRSEAAIFAIFATLDGRTSFVRPSKGHPADRPIRIDVIVSSRTYR
jgi:hypothetical protein